MVSADESRPETATGKIKGKAKTSGNKTSCNKASGKTTEKKRSTTAQKSQKVVLAPEALMAAREPLQEAELPAELQEAQLPAEQPVAAAETVDADAEADVGAEADVSAEADVGVVAVGAAPAPVGVRTITDAYGSYTRKSIEQTSSFFEQLSRARSLDKAFALQTEFAQQALQTFVDESQRIRELHRELARQRLQRLEGLVMGRKSTGST